MKPFPKFDLAYSRHPAFAFRMDDFDAIMRDDGAVFLWSPSMHAWLQHSSLPGTPAAQPVSDDAPQT